MTQDTQQSGSPTSTDAAQDPFAVSRMSFGDHLDELRRSLIRALIGVLLATILAFAIGDQILGIVIKPLLTVQYANGLQPSLTVLSPMGGFTAYLKISFLSGLILAMPWALYQLWSFIASGLHSHERRFIRTLAPASLGLFVVGVLFLYYIVLPIVLHFFITFNSSFGLPNLELSRFEKMVLPEHVEGPAVADAITPGTMSAMTTDPTSPKPGDWWINTTTRRIMFKTATDVWSVPLQQGALAAPMTSQFALDSYISFVLMLALAFGIAFETPIAVFFLSWSGIVPIETMKRGRRYVLLAMVFVSAVLTPPDVISQILLAGPMYLLFEIGLFVSKMTQRP